MESGGARRVNRTPPSQRLARVISKSGLASRRVASAWIAAGHVKINQRVITDPDYPVHPHHDFLTIHDRPLSPAALRYIAFHKPRGLITTRQDEQGRATVYTCLAQQDAWLAPVGRLDKASEGLLLFTNDTQWAATITNPLHQIAKTYHVQVARMLTPGEISQLRNGVVESNEFLRAATVRHLRAGEKTCWLEIVLHEGKNRQIRRMMATLSVTVLRLVRVAIGSLTLGTLTKGQWRELTVEEVSALCPPTSQRSTPAVKTETEVS